jgi:hypothetical protein
MIVASTNLYDQTNHQTTWHQSSDTRRSNNSVPVAGTVKFRALASCTFRCVVLARTCSVVSIHRPHCRRMTATNANLDWTSIYGRVTLNQIAVRRVDELTHEQLVLAN